ncbi:hypothetical protein [Aminipila sp.]|uniref:hypothetical protein n=1 Tax=Aminipila sp. TaxID=2060095 RepID=UPI002899BEA3|nr:hypothetical protein [Aminipila sp.]
MKYMKKKIWITFLAMGVIGFVSACGQSDVVGQVAKTSFAAVLEAMPNQIEEDEINVGWSLSAPDSSARFIWSKDYSKSPIHDVMMEFDAAPFINAGLDLDKLPQEIALENKIMLGVDLGEDELKYKGEAAPSEAFNQLVERYRESIGYHEVLDHYGVDLGEGNKFEWAKDMSSNDKDIVFVVDPAIFMEAGVSPEQVEGWNYADVEIKDKTGKPLTVKKFLKPFDIE